MIKFLNFLLLLQIQIKKQDFKMHQPYPEVLCFK